MKYILLFQGESFLRSLKETLKNKKIQFLLQPEIAGRFRREPWQLHQQGQRNWLFNGKNIQRISWNLVRSWETAGSGLLFFYCVLSIIVSYPMTQALIWSETLNKARCNSKLDSKCNFGSLVLTANPGKSKGKQEERMVPMVSQAGQLGRAHGSLVWRHTKCLISLQIICRWFGKRIRQSRWLQPKKSHPGLPACSQNLSGGNSFR